MILSGEKKEEYREITPYYEARFKNLWKGSLIGGLAERKIMFRNGYSKNSPSLLRNVLQRLELETQNGEQKKESYTIY